MNIRAGTVRRAIYDLAAKRRYLALAHIQAALPQFKKPTVAVTVYAMCNVPDELTVVGTQKDALAKGLPGFDGIDERSYVYALAGTPRLREGEIRRKGLARVDVPKNKSRRHSSSGSGVIAPPPYRMGYRWSLW